MIDIKKYFFASAKTGLLGLLAIAAPAAFAQISMTDRIFFGDVLIGAAVERDITLTNTSATTGYALPALLTASSGNSFTRVSTTCGANLAASTSCAIRLRFTASTSTLVTDQYGVSGVGVSYLSVNAITALGSVGTVTPSAVDFGALSNGQSAQARVTLTNTTSSAYSVRGAVTGTNFYASQNTGCSFSSAVVSPGATCEVIISKNTYSGVVGTTYDSPTQIITSAGTISVPSRFKLVSDTTPAPFTAIGAVSGVVQQGPAPAGYGYTQTHEFENTTGAAVTITGIKDFYYASYTTIAGGTCTTGLPKSIAAGARCTVVLSTIAPNAIAEMSRGLIGLFSDAGYSEFDVFIWALEAARPPVANPVSLDFGSHVISTSYTDYDGLTRYARASVEVTNTAFNYTMRVLNQAFVSSSRWVLDGSTCGGQYSSTLVAPLASCRLQFRYDLSSAFTSGPFPTNTTYELFTNLGKVSIPLTIALGAPTAKPVVSNVDFGVLAQGWGSTSPPMTISNPHAGPITISSLGYSSLTAPIAHFALSSLNRNGGTCPAAYPFTLAAGANCTVTFQIASDLASAFVGNLIHVNSSTGGVHAELSGESYRGLSPVTTDVAALNFGLNPKSTTSDSSSGILTFSVFNPNWQSVDLRDPRVTTLVALPQGSNLNTYVLRSDCPPGPLPSGETCVFKMYIGVPGRASWSASGKVTFDTEAGLLELPWSASGTNPKPASGLVFEPATLDLGGALSNGSSWSRELTLRNTSSTAANIVGRAEEASWQARDQFERTGGTCPTVLPFSLAAGASCTMGYAYRTNEYDGYAIESLNLLMHSDIGSARAQVVAQRVDGKAAPSATTTLVDFGAVDLSSSTRTPITVNLVIPDTTTQNVSFTVETDSGVTYPDYFFSSGTPNTSTCLQSPRPPGACTIILLPPTGSVNSGFTGTFVLSTSSGSVRIPARMTAGTKPILSNFFTELGANTFRSQMVGTTSQAFEIPISFSSYLSNQISSITSTNPAFQVSEGSCGPIPASLANTYGCTFKLIFSPTSVGFASGEIRATNAFGTSVINVSGTGIVAGPSLTLSASVIDVPASRMYSYDWAAGSTFATSARARFSVSNATGETAWLTVSVPPANDGTNSFFSNRFNCFGFPQLLPTGQSCDYDIFARRPVIGEVMTGSLEVASASGVRSVTLRSTGTHGRFDQSKAQFDTDGKADILWQNPVSGRFAVWLMQGYGSKAGNFLGEPGPGWKAVDTGDFNRDGKADVLLYNETSGQTAIWLLNALTVADGRIILNDGPSGWRPLATGDFDDDGHADIVWYHPSSGGIAVWMMNGMNYREGQAIYYGGGPNDWKPVTTADLNGDAKSDIILHKASTGETGVWFMNGMQWAGGGLLRWDVPGGWKPVSAMQLGISNESRSALMWFNPTIGAAEYSFYNGINVQITNPLWAAGANPGAIPLRTLSVYGSDAPNRVLVYSPSDRKTYLREPYLNSGNGEILSEADSGYQPY